MHEDVIREQAIRTAANIKSEEMTVVDGYRAGVLDGFMIGAEWFPNSIWHPSSEVPTIIDASLLIEVAYFGWEGTEFATTIYDGVEYEFNLSNCNLVRWAYIEDLLPREVVLQ